MSAGGGHCMPHLRGGHWPSSALHPSGGRSAPPPPGGFCGTVVPAAPDMRGGLAPSSALLPCMGAPPHAPGDFLAKRKSPKIRQGPPGPWTPSTRGRTPLDSPTFCPSGIGCGNLNSQASSKPILPSHGLKAESVPSMKPEEKTRPICPPTQSGKSVFCCV